MFFTGLRTTNQFIFAGQINSKSGLSLVKSPLDSKPPAWRDPSPGAVLDERRQHSHRASPHRAPLRGESYGPGDR